MALSEDGQDAVSTLLVANKLATALRGVGQTDRAIGLLEHAVDYRMRIFGDEHSDTLVSMANLVVVLLEAGNYIRARAFNERVLAARERVLGADHPATQDSREGLRLLLELIEVIEVIERVEQVEWLEQEPKP